MCLELVGMAKPYEHGIVGLGTYADGDGVGLFIQGDNVYSVIHLP